jgi:photosystem II stability/assembly factor-like uncharacterized protein
MPNTTLWRSIFGWGLGSFLGLTLISATAVFGQSEVRWDALEDVGNLGRVSAIDISPFDGRTFVAGGDVLGAGVTHDGGATWLQTIGFANYQDNDTTFHPTDPNTLWMGTLGGPYKSTDGGITWTLKRDGMPPISSTTISAPIERVIFDPNNANTLLAVAGNHRHMGYGKNGITYWGGVWKSTDGGEHWNQISTIRTARQTYDGKKKHKKEDAAVDDAELPENGVTGVMINDFGFAAGSSTILFACSDKFGVYKSTDGGSTWKKINSGLPNTEAWSIALHPTNSNILWVSLGAGGGVYKSTNGGASWTNSSTGITGLNDAPVFRTIAVAKSNPDYLYVTAWEGGGSAFRSTDGGNSWKRIVDHGSHDTIVTGTGNGSTLAFQRITVDPNDPKHVVGACEGMVVQSFDAGTTWHDTTSFATNGGWRGTGYSGMCGTKIAWDPYKPGLVFTLGDDEGKLERSTDYLWSWTLKGSLPNLTGPYNGASDVTFAADDTIYIGSGQFGNRVPPYDNEPIIKSTDHGKSWFYVKRPQGAIGDNRAVYVKPNDSRQVWCIAGSNTTGTLYKSNNGGITWTALNLGTTGGLWNIAADPKNTRTMYLGAQTGIYKSTDGAHFFLMKGSPTSENFEYVYLDPIDPRTVYATSFNARANGGLYRFRDGSWNRIFVNPQARVVAVDPANPRRIAVATQGWTAFDQTSGTGIWITQDDGATWKQSNDGLRMWDGPALAFNPDKSGQLIYATDGAGFYVTDLGDSTPQGGKVPSVVGTIAAADYDDGLQGFNTPTGNRGNALSGLKTMQWAKYKVNVPSSGYYNITCSVASKAEGKFHIEFNGVNVTGPINVKNTGGPSAWTDVHIPHVQLFAGDQYMRYFAESDSLNVNSFQTSKQ